MAAYLDSALVALVASWPALAQPLCLVVIVLVGRLVLCQVALDLARRK